MQTLTKSTSKNDLTSYSALLKRVREAIARGKERAADAVERELVRTKWEVGKLIQEHILLNKARADYGARVLKRLSSNLGISNTELKYMREFARTYPAIGRVPGQLNWSQIQVLLGVNEDLVRAVLASRAAKENWTWEKTRSEIKKLKAAKQITTSEIPADELLIPKRGKLDTYKIVLAKLGPWQGKPVVDLGFSNYLELPGQHRKKFKARDVVQCSKRISPERYTLNAVRSSEEDLFTYRVYLDEVTDADTLWVLVDLGFGITTKQQLRLRGVDAPEITTREGQAAKKFVERQLKSASQIIITSTKSDKYDRYLADVYYTINGKEKFLNNELLKRRLGLKVS